MSTARILTGDALEMLRTLPDESVHCCVTSPPYWGLRDYGVDGQLGLEETPEEYVEKLVAVFREVRRVLRDDGTLWLNLGDCYYSGDRGGWRGDKHRWEGSPIQPDAKGSHMDHVSPNRMPQEGLKDKDMVGIPWRVAFALRDDGWWLRSDIVWSKPNPMPSSVQDRPTCAHEYVFLMSKSARYHYDNDAIAEPAKEESRERYKYDFSGTERTDPDGHERTVPEGQRKYKPTRNKRTVWEITVKSFSDAHFATFPPELAKTCILAGCPEGGTVLDPFAGSGTTGMVATGHGRDAILIDLNPDYVEMMKQRIGPMFVEAA